MDTVEPSEDTPTIVSSYSIKATRRPNKPKAPPPSLYPKCTVATCDREVMVVNGIPTRYCDKCHNFDGYSLLRKSFAEDVNRSEKGWRQPIKVQDKVDLIKDRFEAERI